MDVSSPMPSIRFSSTGRDLSELLAEVPSGAVIELAPGRYRGPIRIERPVTLVGAGDLTRFEGADDAPIISVCTSFPGLVYLESMTLAEGHAEKGAALSVESGRVRLFNVQLRDCRARDAGGGLWMGGGEVEARLLRLFGLQADRGGAVAVEGDARFVVFDGECRDTVGRLGGALNFADKAVIKLSGVTFSRTRATAAAGGQVGWIGRGRSPGPCVELERVRFEDAPLGQPLVVAEDCPGRVVLFGCDVPAEVATNAGIIDGGNNTWR